MHRAGKLGGLAAWVGFTLPSAVILTALAIWARDADLAGAGWVHGLELAAAAVVLTAVIAMARTLARGAVKAALAIAATAVALVLPGHVRAARDDPRRGCRRQLRCSAAGWWRCR